MKLLFTTAALFLGSLFASENTKIKGDPNGILGIWLNQEGTSHIKIFKGTSGVHEGKFYGNIVWLKEPDKNGKPKVDENNPKKEKQNTPLLNLQILKNFKYTSENTWEDGTIYDPKNGETYSCIMKLDGDKLNVRGYVGISLIGRTAVWTRVK